MEPVQEGMCMWLLRGQCSKIVNSILQRLAFHQNLVEFYQQFNGAIRTSLTASYVNARCCEMSSSFCLDQMVGRSGGKSAENFPVWRSFTLPKNMWLHFNRKQQWLLYFKKSLLARFFSLIWFLVNTETIRLKGLANADDPLKVIKQV